MSEKWWTFGKGDFVAIRAVLGIAVALSGLPVLSQLLTWLSGEPLVWSGYTSAEPPAVPEQVQRGASGHWDDKVLWQIPHATPGQWIASLMPSVWGLVAMSLAVWILWSLLRAVQRGDAFTEASVSGVRRLGVVVAGFVLGSWVLNVIADQAVMAPLRTGSMVFVTKVTAGDLALCLTAFLLLALAEVFRQGRRLRDDVAGLV